MLHVLYARKDIIKALNAHTGLPTGNFKCK